MRPSPAKVASGLDETWTSAPRGSLLHLGTEARAAESGGGVTLVISVGLSERKAGTRTTVTVRVTEADGTVLAEPTARLRWEPVERSPWSPGADHEDPFCHMAALDEDTGEVLLPR